MKRSKKSRSSSVPKDQTSSIAHHQLTPSALEGVRAAETKAGITNPAFIRTSKRGSPA
jgi:hypothetical protein